MAPPTIPLEPPAALVAGDSATWDDAGFTHAQFGSFTSTDWTLTYRFVGPKAVVSITSTANGTGWRTALTTTHSKQLKDAATATTDAVKWFAQVSSGSDQFTVADGTLLVFANPAALTAGLQSRTETMIAALEAAELDAVQSGVASFTIQGRGVVKWTLAEIRRSLAYYRSIRWREQHPGQMGPAIAARFT